MAATESRKLEWVDEEELETASNGIHDDAAESSTNDEEEEEDGDDLAEEG